MHQSREAPRRADHRGTLDEHLDRPTTPANAKLHATQHTVHLGGVAAITLAPSASAIALATAAALAAAASALAPAAQSPPSSPSPSPPPPPPSPPPP